MNSGHKPKKQVTLTYFTGFLGHHREYFMYIISTSYWPTVTKFAQQVHLTCRHQLTDSPLVWPIYLRHGSKCETENSQNWQCREHRSPTPISQNQRTRSPYSRVFIFSYPRVTLTLILCLDLYIMQIDLRTKMEFVVAKVRAQTDTLIDA